MRISSQEERGYLLRTPEKIIIPAAVRKAAIYTMEKIVPPCVVPMMKIVFMSPDLKVSGKINPAGSRLKTDLRGQRDPDCRKYQDSDIYGL